MRLVHPDLRNVLHVLGVMQAFLSSFITFWVMFWLKGFREGLEHGGYTAMSGMTLIVLVHLYEAREQPAALHRNWVVTSGWYAGLAAVAVLLWGIGFHGLLFGLFWSAVTAVAICMGIWSQYLVMRGLHRPPAEWH
ncbi:MAG TPA: hypothetical protein VLA88_06750 [Candidatus Saccharimonadales bacterium]|nr:hypothetical protein [Candidatus Saccharimonadales bacterium]